MNEVTVESYPIKIYDQILDASYFFVSEPSLFIGLEHGNIIQWTKAPGETQRTFVGHRGSVVAMMQHEEVLWSSGKDYTLRWWSLISGECIRNTEVQYVVFAFTKWREYLVGGAAFPLIHLWRNRTE